MWKCSSLNVVTVDKVGAVAIGHIEIAVGSESDIGGLVLLIVLVARLAGRVLGILGILENKQLLAIERGLHHFMLIGGRQIQKLVIPFLAKLHAVGALAPLGSPRVDEFAIRIENEHRIGRAILMVDQNSPLRIFLHHVCVAESHSLGNLRPAVDCLVSVIAAPQNRLGLPALSSACRMSGNPAMAAPRINEGTTRDGINNR